MTLAKRIIWISVHDCSPTCDTASPRWQCMCMWLWVYYTFLPSSMKKSNQSVKTNTSLFFSCVGSGQTRTSCSLAQIYVNGSLMPLEQLKNKLKRNKERKNKKQRSLLWLCFESGLAFREIWGSCYRKRGRNS